MTLTKWKVNPHNQQRLAELLADPVLQSAFDVIRQAHEPTVPDRDGGLITAEVNSELARRYAHRAGVYGALRFLEKLASPEQIVSPTLAEWGTLQSDSAIRPLAQTK